MIAIIAGKSFRCKLLQRDVLQRDDAGDQDPTTSIETGQTRINIMIKEKSGYYPKLSIEAPCSKLQGIFDHQNSFVILIARQPRRTPRGMRSLPDSPAG
jgi:hypothetical protein